MFCRGSNVSVQRQERNNYTHVVCPCQKLNSFSDKSNVLPDKLSTSVTVASRASLTLIRFSTGNVTRQYKSLAWDGPRKLPQQFFWSMLLMTEAEKLCPDLSSATKSTEHLRFEEILSCHKNGVSFLKGLRLVKTTALYFHQRRWIRLHQKSTHFCSLIYSKWRRQITWVSLCWL